MDLGDFTISTTILSNTATKNKTSSIFEALPNEILSEILRYATVIDQICTALCSKQLGVIVMAIRKSKPFSPALTLAVTEDTVKSTDVVDREYESDDDEEEGEHSETDDETGDDDSETDGEGDSDYLSDDEYGAGDGPKLFSGDYRPHYKRHGRKILAKLELLRRLATWSPSSFGICQWCVRYRPKAQTYWLPPNPIFTALKELIEWRNAAKDELYPDYALYNNNQYPPSEMRHHLGLLKTKLDKELGFTGRVDVIDRWSDSSRGYETVKCSLDQGCDKGAKSGISQLPRKLTRTVQRFPNRCPECSINAAKRNLPNSVRDRTLGHLIRLHELRDEMGEKLDDLKADLDLAH